MHVAIVGATGAVGREILSLLEKRDFPLSSIACFASKRSLNNSLCFKEKAIPLQELKEHCFANIDLAFFAAGSAISKEWIPQALLANARVIDSSSAFRMQPDTPLIIPEINSHLLHTSKLIASPNCAATILLLPLYPLHKLYRIKRIIATTYQAASGGGFSLMRELEQETKAHLNQTPYSPTLPFPYAFNLFLHNSPLHENGYSDEEMKMALETKKILEDEHLEISATCVRVPVLRAHSISLNVEFERSPSLQEAREAIRAMPGVKLFEDWQENRFATPRDAMHLEEVLCSRVRIDTSRPNTLELWCVGDQLLKGAALNAVQIAEHLKMGEAQQIPSRFA